MSGYFKSAKKNIMENIKKNIINVIILLVVISMFISANVFIFRSKEEARLNRAILRDAIGMRLGRSFAAVNDFPGSAGKDILFLHNLSSVRNLRGTTSRKISPEVYSDFKNILDSNAAYKDLFFYRKNFNCVLRVSGDNEYDNDLCETPPLIIADVLAQAVSLSMGEVYISPPMSYKDIFPEDEEKEDVVAIIYVTPVNNGSSVISIIDVNYFFEEIRRLAREGEAVFLLDQDGAYLASADRGKEKFLGSADNFYRDFSEIPAGALSDTDIRWLETKDKIFAFWRIYPTESNFAIYEGANKILGGEHQDEYFWAMAAVSDKLYGGARYGDLFDIFVIMAVLIIHFFIIGFLLVFRFSFANNK